MFWRPRESIRSCKALGSAAEVVYCVDGRLLLAVKSLYSPSEVCVRVVRVKSRTSTVASAKGVLSPLLFIVDNT